MLLNISCGPYLFVTFPSLQRSVFSSSATPFGNYYSLHWWRLQTCKQALLISFNHNRTSTLPQLYWNGCRPTNILIKHFQCHSPFWWEQIAYLNGYKFIFRDNLKRNDLSPQTKTIHLPMSDPHLIRPCDICFVGNTRTSFVFRADSPAAGNWNRSRDVVLVGHVIW